MYAATVDFSGQVEIYYGFMYYFPNQQNKTYLFSRTDT